MHSTRHNTTIGSSARHEAERLTKWNIHMSLEGSRMFFGRSWWASCRSHGHLQKKSALYIQRLEVLGLKMLTLTLWFVYLKPN